MTYQPEPADPTRPHDAITQRWRCAAEGCGVEFQPAPLADLQRRAVGDFLKPAQLALAEALDVVRRMPTSTDEPPTIDVAADQQKALVALTRADRLLGGLAAAKGV